MSLSIPTLRWNPFAIVAHNEWRLPRALFLLVHAAIGLPVYFLALAFHTPVAWNIAATFLVAIVDKCTWIDWHRTSGQFFHSRPFSFGDPWDFVSDLLLTIVGAVAPFTRWTPIAIYVLSTFNGT